MPNEKKMAEVDQSDYKYLGVLEEADIMVKEMKDKVTKEYLGRIKLTAKSQLYGRNLISAINAWVIGVVRYSAGVINWSDAQLKRLDVKTRKILTMFGVFHKRSSVDRRLYVKIKNGGEV